MKVTVCLGSGRPGGIDVSLRGLADQAYTGDWEVVFTDAIYFRRHAAVLDAVKATGLKVPFFHVPNHRYSGSLWGTTCAGYNTSIALADGDLIIMLCDYAYAPPGWIEAHVAQHMTPTLCMAPHIYYGLPRVVSRDGRSPRVFADGSRDMTPEIMADIRESYGDISIFVDPFTPDVLTQVPRLNGDPKIGRETGPIPAPFFHTKNESFPRDAWFDVNGMDEFFDRGRGPGDTEVAERLERAGLQPWLCAEAAVHCLNPRPILPNPNGSTSENERMAPPHHERFTYQEGAAYASASRSEGRRRAPNPMSMEELRAKIWHWRDESQRREASIPRRIVSDAEYFK